MGSDEAPDGVVATREGCSHSRRVVHCAARVDMKRSIAHHCHRTRPTWCRCMLFDRLVGPGVGTRVRGGEHRQRESATDTPTQLCCDDLELVAQVLFLAVAARGELEPAMTFFPFTADTVEV